MSAIELRGDRVAGNNSILARADGSFFDFNGSVNYSNVQSLLKVHPELMSGNDGYKPPSQDYSSAHDSRAVTEVAQQMKARFTYRPLEQYLPLYDYNQIQSNVGNTYSGELAVFMWKPTLLGATRGSHYGIAQYRGDPRAKWMSIKGSDSKNVESMVFNENPIYTTFGIGDFLLLKSTGLNYMCFAGDGGAKNSPHKKYMECSVGNRTIRLIADNDSSGQETVNYLRSYGFKVKVFGWKQLGDLAEPKMDLRDLAKMIKSRGGNLSDLKELITQEIFYEYI